MVASITTGAGPSWLGGHVTAALGIGNGINCPRHIRCRPLAVQSLVVSSTRIRLQPCRAGALGAAHHGSCAAWARRRPPQSRAGVHAICLQPANAHPTRTSRSREEGPKRPLPRTMSDRPAYCTNARSGRSRHVPRPAKGTAPAARLRAVRRREDRPRARSSLPAHRLAILRIWRRRARRTGRVRLRRHRLDLRPCPPRPARGSISAHEHTSGNTWLTRRGHDGGARAPARGTRRCARRGHRVLARGWRAGR